MEDKSWAFIEHLGKELQKYDRRKYVEYEMNLILCSSNPFYDNYIFEGISKPFYYLFFYWPVVVMALQSFFSQPFEPKDMNSERIKIANGIFDILFELAGAT